MNEYRRELLFRVLDDEPKLLPTLHQLDHYVRCDDMLRWLIQNRLTGKNLLSWMNLYFPKSILNMPEFILFKIKKDLEQKPVVYGKDYLECSQKRPPFQLG